MKKTKIFLLILSVFLIVSIICGIVVYYNHQHEVEQLDTCYVYISETINEGFDKERALERKILFKNVLENGISKSAFKKSEFYNSDISFSINGSWSCPKEREDLSLAHCRDLVLAMYLSCVLSTEPENLVYELEWLKDGVWQLDPKPEFMHLISTKYNPSKEDIDCLVNSIIAFSQTLEHPLDKYHTRAFVYTFVNDYNENNKSDKYVFVNEEKFIEENIEISKDIDKEDFATIWVGYGKVIRYNTEDGSKPLKKSD